MSLSLLKITLIVAQTYILELENGRPRTIILLLVVRVQPALNIESCLGFDRDLSIADVSLLKLLLKLVELECMQAGNFEPLFERLVVLRLLLVPLAEPFEKRLPSLINLVCLVLFTVELAEGALDLAEDGQGVDGKIEARDANDYQAEVKKQLIVSRYVLDEKQHTVECQKSGKLVVELCAVLRYLFVWHGRDEYGDMDDSQKDA